MSASFYIIVIYMGVMILIGATVSRRKVKNSKDFLLAGRSLGPWMMAGTLAATEIGGGSTLGVAAKAYGEWGLSAGWYVVCAGIGVFSVSFIAPRLRAAMATTVPEILRRRYGRPTHIISSALSIGALFLATAAQITACASVIQVATGLDAATTVIMVACVVTAYTMLGGLMAIAFTDIVHILVITVGMAIALPVIVHNAGGWDFIVESLPAQQMSMTNIGWSNIIGLTLLYFMTFSTGQEAVQRYFAAKDSRTARKGSFMCALLMACYGFIPAMIGLVALAHFPGIEPNTAMPTAAQAFAPTLLAGLVMAGVVAATMSSASGNMIAVGTMVMQDVYLTYVNPNAPDQAKLRLSKVVIVCLGVCGMAIALGGFSIIGLMISAFTLRSAGPFAAFVIGLFYRNATVNGGLWSIVIGSVAGMGWQLAGEPYGVMSIIFGAGLSVLSFFTISIIERRLGRPAAPPAIAAYQQDNDEQMAVVVSPESVAK
ncbi:sodium:solute symporter [Aeromonas sp. MdU4]|uniref:sodium:solute symporter family protein n=1 Tax=Aeromonas sp. MdU4 TaxID=3342819 RepID=UPI0035B78C98